tara:strand:- start:6605 stop:7624 length:1020 start_codon:yes stop_codon:yes gene_type:complete
MSSSDPNDPVEILRGVTDLLDSVPGTGEILEKVMRGESAPEEAVAELFKLMAHAGEVETLASASQALAVAVGVEHEDHSVDRPLIMDTSTGGKTLNPIYSAAVAERAFLDGDVPELRSGLLPEGASPAVPVLTTARDPIMVGAMLEKASAQVLEEMRFAIEDHGTKCVALLEAARKESTTALKKVTTNLPAPPLGATGYEAGQLPALRSIEVPTTGELAALPDEKRREYAYKAVSTTQGRRSLSQGLQAGLKQRFEAAGVSLEEGTLPKKGGVSSTWTVTLLGAEEISEGFSPVEAAIESMFSDLHERVLNLEHPVLEVVPFNGIADRRFGWTARVASK